MREHKYRAWDKKTKQMREVIAIVYSDFQIETECYGDLGDPVVDAGVWIKNCLMVEHRDFKDIELIQYTGLKDKNGKEIYEGDIISDCFKHPDKEDTCHYLGPSKKGIIEWNINHAGFYIETDRWEDDMYMTEITGPTTSHQIMPEWIEIIGNIYENPELASEVEL